MQKPLQKNLDWIFRELPSPDVGIDAFVETCDQGNATGKILALQIKSGQSYFAEGTGEGVFYRGDLDHLEYWEKYSIPVLVVLHDGESSQCYWQLVETSNVSIVGKSWKLFVPYYQKFDFHNRNVLMSIAQHQDLYTYNLRNLKCFREIMRDLAKGCEWYLYIETEPGFNIRKGAPHYVELSFSKKPIKWYPRYQEADLVFSTTFYPKARLFNCIEKLLPWAKILYQDISGVEKHEVASMINDFMNYDDLSTFEDDIKSELNEDISKISLLELASYVDVGVNFEAKLRSSQFGECFLKIDEFLDSSIVAWGEEFG